MLITISTAAVLNSLLCKKNTFPPGGSEVFTFRKKNAVPVRHSLATNALLLVLCEHELTSENLAEKAIQSGALRWL